MNRYLFAAAALAFIVGLVHSALGEVLIFSRMRKARLVPTDGGSILHERHVRILWASWHVVTVLGWCMAANLFWLGARPLDGEWRGFLMQSILLAMLASSALVLIGTRGKHPGWIGLLGVAVLVWVGA